MLSGKKKQQIFHVYAMFYAESAEWEIDNGKIRLDDVKSLINLIK